MILLTQVMHCQHASKFRDLVPGHDTADDENPRRFLEQFENARKHPRKRQPTRTGISIIGVSP
jgi:hypothetical protein